jgi:hypothetical protein
MYKECQRRYKDFIKAKGKGKRIKEKGKSRLK